MISVSLGDATKIDRGSELGGVFLAFFERNRKNRALASKLV